MTTVQRQHYGTSLRNIIHPTDFSHGSDVAFAHALRLTLGCGGDLEILHVERGREKSNWERYPSVRQVLAQWGELPPHAARGDVARLGVNISKAVCTNSGTADGVLDHIHTRGAGLVVMATHQREGLDRWLHASLAERVATRTEAATLFVPYGVDGFVNLSTGDVSLRNILVPIDSSPVAQLSVNAVSELVSSFTTATVEIHLLHVGDPADMPGAVLPALNNAHWRWETRTGPVVDTICEYATTADIDLIVMASDGHDGFLDAIRGSTTDRVLRRSQCPLLSVHDQAG